MQIHNVFLSAQRLLLQVLLFPLTETDDNATFDVDQNDQDVHRLDPDIDARINHRSLPRPVRPARPVLLEVGTFCSGPTRADLTSPFEVAASRRARFDVEAERCGARLACHVQIICRFQVFQVLGVRHLSVERKCPSVLGGERSKSARGHQSSRLAGATYRASPQATIEEAFDLLRSTSLCDSNLTPKSEVVASWVTKSVPIGK